MLGTRRASGVPIYLADVFMGMYHAMTAQIFLLLAKDTPVILKQELEQNLKHNSALTLEVRYG